MAHEFITQRQVEFAETDMAGIMHFSNYFRFMEATEHYFFHSLGLALHWEEEGVMRGWVRVRAECDYREPLRYLDHVSLHLVVLEKRSKVLRHAVLFRRIGEGGEAGAEIARGMMTVVHVEKRPGDRDFRAVPMSADVDASLEAAPSRRLKELKLTTPESARRN